jgi:hypothetical protein
LATKSRSPFFARQVLMATIKGLPVKLLCNTQKGLIGFHMVTDDDIRLECNFSAVPRLE